MIYNIKKDGWANWLETKRLLGYKNYSKRRLKK